MMKLAALLSALALSACGGGGSDGQTAESVTVTWGQYSYEVVTNPLSTASQEARMSAQVNGLARDTSGNLPQIAASVSYAPQSNQITLGNGPHWMNSSGAIPVTATISTTGDVQPSYPVGTYDVTVSFNIKNGNTGETKTYSAVTKLVVK